MLLNAFLMAPQNPASETWDVLSFLYITKDIPQGKAAPQEKPFPLYVALILS